MQRSQLDRARRWIFARHAHPISAWSRWATTPLILVPLWTRRWSTAIPVAAWMLINPVLTPPVSDDHAFATRAMLGEEQWTKDRADRGGIVALNVTGSACLVIAGVAARKRRPVPMVLATATAMITTLLTWREYANHYAATRHR